MASDTQNAEVQYALIKNFARQTPVNVTVTTFTIGFVIWMTYPYVPGILLFPWVALHLGLPALLFARWSWRRRAQSPDAQIEPRKSIGERAVAARRRAIIFALYSGVMWGSTVAAMIYLPSRLQVALTIIVGALVGGATTTLSAIPLAAGLYGITAIVPFSAYFFLFGTENASVILGSLAIIMLSGMIWASRSVHGTYLENIQARVSADAALVGLKDARDDWLDIAAASDAFALFDRDKKLKFWNEAMEKAVTIPFEIGLPMSAMVTHVSGETISGVPAGERYGNYLPDQDNTDRQTLERWNDGRWVRSIWRRTPRGYYVWRAQEIPH